MVMKASTPTITTMTMAPANNGMGWSKGMAPQVSLPNIFISPSARRRPDLSQRLARDPAAMSDQDLVEQSVGYRAEGEWRRHNALLGQFNIAFRREFISG